MSDQKELDRWKKYVDIRDAHIKKLERALLPFANVCEMVEKDTSREHRTLDKHYVYYADLRGAKKALDGE